MALTCGVSTVGDIVESINNINVDNIASLLLIDVAKHETVNVRGYYTPNDGGGGIFNYDATQSAVNNGGTIINGWVRQYSGYVHSKWFGVRSDGAWDGSALVGTDDAIPLQKFFDYIGSTLECGFMDNGVTMIGSNVTVDRFTQLTSGNAPSTSFAPTVGFIGTEVITVNDTGADIDGIILSNFWLDGNNVDGVALLKLNQVNVLTTMSHIGQTRLGVGSIAVSIDRGSDIIFDKCRFNGGFKGGVYVGTSIYAENVPGIFFGDVNIEHADVGFHYRNSGVNAVFNPTIKIDSLYTEHHASHTMLYEAGFNGDTHGTTHFNAGALININHIEHRSSLVANGNILTIGSASYLDSPAYLDVSNIFYTGNVTYSIEIFLTAGNITSTKLIQNYVHKLGLYLNESNWETSMPFAIGAKVIDSGTWVNGNWVKYADGTMICEKVVDDSANAVTTATGALFVSATLLWNLPQTFIASPTVSISVERGQAIAIGASIFSVSTTAVNYEIWSSISIAVGNTKKSHLTAIGRWKV